MPPQIRKILYAIDLSKNSALAFRYAVEVAQQQNAQIVILHVIEPIPPQVRHYISVYVNESRWEEKLRTEQDMAIERIKKRLEEFCKREAAKGSQCLSLVSEILVRSGHPVEEILKAADERPCDLIMLGTHGKGFLRETFLGSTARSVLARTRKPVFIIPLPESQTDVTFEEI
jgi:nucleotide-binding universal stress UspA family protein